MNQKQVKPKSNRVNPDFNDAHVTELCNRFNRLIKTLGYNNQRQYSMEDNCFVGEGSERYKFEVDFAYAIHELQVGPFYLKGKLFDDANAIVNDLVAFIKKYLTTEKSEAQEASV